MVILSIMKAVFLSPSYRWQEESTERSSKTTKATHAGNLLQCPWPQLLLCTVHVLHLTFWSSISRSLTHLNISAAAAAKSLQSCPTLFNPIDGSPPGSSVPGILQSRTLEWVAISFSNAWKWKVKVKSPSRARLFATPWTAAYQTPPSMRFSRQE